MRAIIIEEDRFTEFVELMRHQAQHHLERDNTADVPPEVWKRAVEEAYGQWNYQFVRWAQSHGARCVR